MGRTRNIAILIALAATAPPLSAQSAPPDFRGEFSRQFEASARKIVALAGAMPAATYQWRPMEGVASVARAYMHIARYNYMYPEQSLGVAAPDGMEYGRWEDEVTEKAEVLEILRTSMDHVRGVVATMSAEDLERTTTLYGREVPQWSVLLQLITHMNEHLGQQIAYARMNEVVPPWSR